MKKNYLKFVAVLSLLVFLFLQSLYATGGKLPAYAKHGMVTSSSIIASEVGRDVLKSGGNAVDAAVATALTLAVTWPSAGNIGGGGFMIYYSHDGKATAFDFREKAPLAAFEKMYLTPDGKIRNNSNHDGILAVGVPGTVAGLYLAHQKLGRKPWKELVAPAIKLAGKGFPYTWALHRAVTSYYAKIFKKYPSTAKKMLKKSGQVYEPGEIWRQPDLAKTLKRIQKYGRDGFYKGETARKLADFMKKNGGLITGEDLAKYQAVERKPVHGTYRGYDVYSMCPPSSGGVVLVEMLNILEGYNLKEIGWNSALYLHLLTEAMRRAYADRAYYLGDPDFNPDMPLDKLTSKSHAAALRKSIQLFKASQSDSASFSQIYEGDHTTHFSIIDANGNAVSMTFTLERSFGSKIVADGLGFLLNNEMGDFNPIPGVTDSRGHIGTPPNRIAPEKRMLSSMTPTIVAKANKPVLLIGSPGGRTIINTVLQVILNVIDHEMNIAQAVEAGRIHHQWLPDVTSFERWAVSKDTRQLYENMGHKVRIRNYQGSAMGIYIDWKTGLITGAADSRSPDGGVAGF